MKGVRKMPNNEHIAVNNKKRKEKNTHTVLTPMNEHIGRHERGHEDMTKRSRSGQRCPILVHSAWLSSEGPPQVFLNTASILEAVKVPYAPV